MISLPAFVRVTKLIDKGTYPDHPIHEGYTIEGVLYEEPTIGKTLVVLRTNRNGVNKVGLFQTSFIVKTTESSDEVSWVVNTENSEYLIEVVKADLAEAQITKLLQDADSP